MKAIILAAGKGTRMMPLTATTPKPLLKVHGKPLIEYHIEKLQKIGITEIAINVHHLGEQIKEYLGDGSRYGVKIFYSEEKELLNSGGGIAQALNFLGPEPFIYVAADIFTDFDFSSLVGLLEQKPNSLTHLILVNNPEFNEDGDFSFNPKNQITVSNTNPYTFSSIGVLKADLFQGVKHKKFPLVDILHLGIANKQITGEIFSGVWHNMGTPEQLASVDNYNKAKAKL